MAIAGALFSLAAFIAASKVIAFAGGDPAGDVADEAALFSGLAAAEQQLPLNRARQQISQLEEAQGQQQRQQSDFAHEAREVALGRRVQGPRELLESIALKMGTTAEGLGKQLSPTRVGDFSSVSKAAFGRSAKRLGPTKGTP